MASERVLPGDPLAFIRRCVSESRMFWTYHVHMGLAGRHIARQTILDAAATYEIIEAYPETSTCPAISSGQLPAGLSFRSCLRLTALTTTSV